MSLKFQIILEIIMHGQEEVPYSIEVPTGGAESLQMFSPCPMALEISSNNNT